MRKFARVLAYDCKTDAVVVHERLLDRESVSYRWKRL